MIKRAVGVAAAVASLLAASPAAARPRVSGEVMVFAAASLTESFTEIAKQFERKYPDVTVRFNFDASSNLAAQIQQGAPAEVFASADDVNLQKAIDSGDVVEPPVMFARNRLAIAVESGNPKRIKRLADLRRSGMVVVLCADLVPCGKYAADVLAKAGVELNPASKEENAKAALSKVSLGEADATIVYVTDVRTAKGDVTGVRIPDHSNVIATYPIGVVKESGNGVAAKAWVMFLQSQTAQKTLRKFGFLPP
jgi:molybdate transport system substrate-binding protein